MSYLPCAILADGKPVVVELKAENNFKLTVEDILPKITESLCAEFKCLPLVSLSYFITARGFVFVGEAIKTSHIGVFLPRLIYLQGKLLGGHKVSPRKIPTKFFPGPVPLIYSLGQQ